MSPTASDPTGDDDMAPRDVQALADATERDAAARYERRRSFAELLRDAVRRADALTRLEARLQTR